MNILPVIDRNSTLEVQVSILHKLNENCTHLMVVYTKQSKIILTNAHQEHECPQISC